MTTDDLASRISDGSVAVLELLPGEGRFAELSHHVLRGGASRFAPVVLESEPIRYVLPVGIPGATLDFGTLLLQRTRCALVWKNDPLRPYRALIMELGPETTVSQAGAAVRGEMWGRFDLRREGTPDMTFLVPPVTSVALPRMLQRVLIDEPRSHAQRLVTEPLSRAVTEGQTQLTPPAPAPAPAATQAPAPQAPPAPRTVAPAPLPAAAPLPTPAPEAPAAAASTPAASQASPGETSMLRMHGTEPDATMPMSAVHLDDWPEQAPRQQRPSSRRGEGSGTWTRRPEAEAEQTTPIYRDDALFRDSARTAPLTPDGYQAPVPPRPVVTQPSAGALPVVVEEEEGEVASPDMLKGFLTGFVVTMIVGGLFVLARVLGWV